MWLITDKQHETYPGWDVSEAGKKELPRFLPRLHCFNLWRAACPAAWVCCVWIPIRASEHPSMRAYLTPSVIISIMVVVAVVVGDGSSIGGLTVSLMLCCSYLALYPPHIPMSCSL